MFRKHREVGGGGVERVSDDNRKIFQGFLAHRKVVGRFRKWQKEVGVFRCVASRRQSSGRTSGAGDSHFRYVGIRPLLKNMAGYREKANRQKCFLILDGHSSHLLLRLLRKAREFNIDIIVYPSHCTHLLQGLDVVCFAPLKQIWAHEIKMFELENFRGVKRDDFAKVFGNAYQRTFTPKLILHAWETTGVFPFNDKIIPPEKMAPSETSTVKYTSSVIHSTPVRKVMEAFSYFKHPPLDLAAVDTEDEEESPIHDRGEVMFALLWERTTNCMLLQV